jgi:hypothetical protein
MPYWEGGIRTAVIGNPCGLLLKRTLIVPRPHHNFADLHLT